MKDRLTGLALGVVAFLAVVVMSSLAGRVIVAGNDLVTASIIGAK
jgi:hypothetical protein